MRAGLSPVRRSPPFSHPATLFVDELLLFAGEGAGGERVLRAYDKLTGDVVHEVQLPGGPTTGFPITYMTGGRQYIVVAVLDEEFIAELVAFTVQ